MIKDYSSWLSESAEAPVPADPAAAPTGPAGPPAGSRAVKLPNGTTGYWFPTPMDYKDGVKRKLAELGPGWKIPEDWDSISGAFKSGAFWTPFEHGTYNISYYDFGQKQMLNDNSMGSHHLLVVKSA